MGTAIGLACLMSVWVTLVILAAQAIRKRWPQPKQPTAEDELAQLWEEVGPDE